MLSELQVSQLFDPEAHVNAKVKKHNRQFSIYVKKRQGGDNIQDIFFPILKR